MWGKNRVHVTFFVLSLIKVVKAVIIGIDLLFNDPNLLSGFIKSIRKNKEIRN